MHWATVAKQWFPKRSSLVTLKNKSKVYPTHFRGVDADGDSGAISLLPLDSLNVDHELFAVALDHFADLLALVVTSNNL